jgi:hypothetical protein
MSGQRFAGLVVEPFPQSIVIVPRLKDAVARFT